MEPVPGADTDLYSLLYCSHATPEMTDDELPRIVGSAWRHNPAQGITGLLVFGGVLTALPLIGFAAAVQRIPFSLVGLLQYISPTLQLLIGVLVMQEPFDQNRAIGFAFIWAALALYAAEGLLRARRSKPALA